MKRVAGHFVTLVGASFLFPGIGFRNALALPGQRGLIPFLIRLVLQIMSPIMISAGGSLYVEGRKMTTLPAKELLDKDKRRPVLYLRSFELEKITAREAGRFALLAQFSTDINIRTQEEVLAKVLNRVGPCIAVGDPRRTDIVLGFSRMSLGNNWQEIVQEHMEKSALVVHCAGGTQGLLWELEQVAKRVKPRSRLLLIVTPTITQEWWELADKLFGRVPRFTVSEEDKRPYVAVIYFDEAGDSHSELVYGIDKSPRVILEEAFDPLLHQLGINPRPKFIRWITDPINLLPIAGITAVPFLLLMFLLFVGIVRSLS